MTRAQRTIGLFAETFASVHAIGRRLLASREDLRTIMPLEASRMVTLSGQEALFLDAFIKRFENIQDILDSQLLRGLLLLEEVDLSSKTPRDLSNLLEKWGIISSAASWRALRDLRNTLAHEYPRQPGIQAERLNEAYDAIDELIAVVERIRAHATGKGFADLSDYPPLS